MLHAKATDPQVRDWLEAAKGAVLDEGQRAAVRELERSYVNATCLPTAFVERQTATRMRCEQLWRTARASGDWAGFAPALDGVVSLVREEAAMRADVLKLAPYDALMEQYDPGNRVADINPVFAELKAFLKSFVEEALDVQAERKAELRRSP